MEDGINEGRFTGGKSEKMKKPSRVTHFGGKKRVRKHAGFKDISETQTKPTALEVINYKTGAQGFPENVEAYEKTVEEQDPHGHAATDLMSKEQWRRETEAAVPYTDFRMEKAVYDAMNDMKKRWGLVRCDFNEATKKWFNEHPADVIYLNTHKVSYSEARKWAGFKTGLKGKGRKVTRAKMTPMERKKAKAEGQRKRAAEARK